MQKTDEFTLKTYKIVIVIFLIQDKLGKIRFFDETVMLADTSMDVDLGMPFLVFHNTDI